MIPHINKLVGEEKGEAIGDVYMNLGKLGDELNVIHTRQLNRLKDLKGPISVRTSGQTVATESRDIVVGDNKIIVGGKTIPNIWLRDNCQCTSCMHESTKQRLQDTFAIPKDLSIKSATVLQATNSREERLHVEWSDGHKSLYKLQFLANATASFDRRSIVRQGLIQLNLWDSSVASDPPIRTYEHVMTGAMSDVLEKIVGLCITEICITTII